MANLTINIKLLLLLLCLGTAMVWAQDPAPKEDFTLGAGTYVNQNYVARKFIKLTNGFKYAAGTGQKFSAKIDAGLLFPPTTNTYANAAGVITTDPTQGGVVGAIPGQFSVSPSGSANYVIPIEVPAGINGMQPNVSLVYNSQGGNGIAGWGWNLSGIPVISKRGSDLFLDGKKLIRIGFTNKLRTEIENFDEITMDGENFILKTKNGLTMRFLQSLTSNWILISMTDANGNYMTYHYSDDSYYGLSLKKIKYNYSLKDGVSAPTSEIEFQYYLPRYKILSESSCIGTLINKTLLLTSIITKSQDIVQRTYSMNYKRYDEDVEYVEHDDELSSFTLKDKNGNQYNPTIINKNEVESQSQSIHSLIKNDIPVTYSGASNALYIDINNDGLLDLVRPKGNTSTKMKTGWDTWISNGKNFIFNQNEDWTEAASVKKPFSGNYKLLPVDINADGNTDLVEICQSEIVTAPNNFIEYQTTVDVLLNINGKFVNQNLVKTVLRSSDETQYSFTVGDFNGDGSIELVALIKSSDYLEHTSIDMYKIDYLDKKLSPLMHQNLNIMEYNLYFINSSVLDTNGDKHPELKIMKGYPRIYANQGAYNESGFWENSCTYDGDFLSSTTYTYNTYNNSFDVIPELSTEEELVPKDNSISDESAQSVDLNSDGIIETVVCEGGKVYVTNTINPSKRVYSITNGLGESIKLAYKPVSDKSVYENSTETIPSTFEKSIPTMNVVCQTIIDKGSLVETTNYAYKGIRIHKDGLGFLGFEEFTSDNSTQNRKTVTQFGYHPTYFNVFPTQITTTTSVGQAISTTTFTNAVQELKLKGNYPIFPYTASQTTTSNLTGVTSKMEMSNFDDGNPGTIITTNGTGADAIVETKTITYVSRGSWCKNKVDVMTVKKTLGTDTETRISKFDYDATTGHLNWQKNDFGDANQVTTTYSLYDSFGNPQTISVEANGKTRTTNLTYKDGRFVDTKINSLNETTNYTWYEDAGLLKSETFRGRTTSYKYNGFGQLTETIYPDGKRNINVLQWSGNVNAKYMLYSETSGSAPVSTFYNAVGQVVKKESYGLNKQKVSQFTEYNTDGTLYRVSEPTFGGSGEKWTTYGYDGYNRKKSILKPDGSTKTDIVYSGLTTSISSTGGSNSTTVLTTAGLTKSSTVNGKQVDYTYYPSGLAKTCTPISGSTVTMVYNLQGKRTGLTDPDLGTTTDVYDGFGQLTSETDAKGNATTFTYDDNGLLQTKVVGTETTSYVYDPTFKNRVKSIEIVGKNKQTMTYDTFDRVTNLMEEIVDQNNVTHSYNRSVAYDFFGRTVKETFPSGYYVTNSYDDYGNLTEVKDKANRSIIKADTQNAFGQATTLFKGGTKTTLGYDPVNHVNNLIQVVAPGNNTLVDYSYGFDTNDNLVQRTDKVNQQDEIFHFDTQNRLIGSDVSRIGGAVTANTITYNDGTGNIDKKSDLGDFAMTYGANGKPHALASIAGKTDAISAANLTVGYNKFNKMETLNEGSKNYQLTYGVDNQRRISTFSTDAMHRVSTYYLGNYEEEINALGNVRKIHYLSGAIFIQNNGKDSLLYTYSDNQGSLIALTDESGKVLERYAYDAWGVRRNPTNWTQKDTRTKWLTNRGYTGHEHLDAFGIINMNGRVYDPATAMFYSPDPMIQSPGDWLNYNRYSYCMNNPLKYTDPTGYYWSNGEWFDDNTETNSGLSQEDIDIIKNNLLNSTYGGHWDVGSNSTLYFQSSTEAFIAGCEINELNNSWGNIEGGAGSLIAAIYNFSPNLLMAVYNNSTDDLLASNNGGGRGVSNAKVLQTLNLLSTSKDAVESVNNLDGKKGIETTASVLSKAAGYVGDVAKFASGYFEVQTVLDIYRTYLMDAFNNSLNNNDHHYESPNSVILPGGATYNGVTSGKSYPRK
jgi:RHS repeat-associated protein